MSSSRSRSPSCNSDLSWEEVNFAEYEELSDDDLRDAVVVSSREATPAAARPDETRSVSEESESPTISSRDGSETPQTPTEVQYFDLTKQPVFTHPNAAARIVQAWWRTMRCPSIHLPDEEDDVIEELAPPSGEGVALRALGSAQWDLWERQMEEDMPLIWENLDRRWLIYTMLLWLVLTFSFQFHMPMAVANSSSAAQASKTPVVQSKSASAINASKKLLLLPKYQIPNLGSSLSYRLKSNWTAAIKTQTALVIRVKTRLVAATITDVAEVGHLLGDAESAWLSEAKVRLALGTGKAIWSRRSELEPSLWPWSFPSPRRPSSVAGLLPPPKPVKQGADFKVWWWLLRQKIAGEIMETYAKLPCLTTPNAQVPLLTWTPQPKTLKLLPLLQLQPDLRIAPKLLLMVRPSTSLTTRMFFNQWQPEMPDMLPAAPLRPTHLPCLDCLAAVSHKVQVSPAYPLTIYNANATKRKAEKERRESHAGAKRLQKGLRKAKKKAEGILEKSRMQALHHLEKARKAFERKVEYARLAAGGCMD